MASAAEAPGQVIPATLGAQLEAELVASHGEAQRERIHRGIAQTAALWQRADGDDKAWAAFVRQNFAGTPVALDALFNRFQHNLEMIWGHTQEIRRELNAPSDLDTGPVASYDEAFAAWDPSAHVLDDLFGNKLAFIALLNFPLTSLEERERQGATWTRQQWAETFLAETFRQRLPAEANLAVAEAYAASDRYIARYNIWMHHLVDAKGNRLFPAGKRLLSHWNLRDELKANYADRKDGPAKQRTIQKVMERIVAQEIPAVVVDNPAVDWNPFTNAVARTTVNDAPAGFVMQTAVSPSTPVDNAREPDLRYARWLANFHAMQVVDKYSPSQPTHIIRMFETGRQLSEARVQSMLEQLLGSPQVKQVAALIQKRLGRKLEPFDIWYAGFKPGAGQDEAQLDAVVARRFPDAAAYQREIPTLLRALGFAPDRADYVARHIVVDPARGSGHAMGAAMKGEPAHLRTRVERGGMNYKGYNIAVHEMCHNVEQTFSLNDVEYYTLHGVPNTAFTEALAFTCQNRDLELLGLSKPDAQSRALEALDTFWGTYEIGGVALVDMQVWRWMYAHPSATPAELRAAVLGIAKDTWNKWYAPVFGVRDVTLLAIYSHMINSMLYLPDYPIGHMIAFQVEAQMEKAGNFGAEFERVSRIGSLAPDLWMIEATGKPVGPEALLSATQQALQSL
ncbi:MAG TPA: hypothetical protein VKO83_04490 [Steroidobacteraceae bacterium]|nr:hypothetical protein [Steroidobacteraceae bacterium]